MRSGPIGAAAVLVVLVLAGCGGSSSKSSSSAPALSKTTYLAKGNAICTAGNRRRARRAAALGNNPSPKQINTYVTKFFIPYVQSTVSDIRALGAPKGDEATVTSFLNLAQADLDKLKAKPLLIATNPGLFHSFAVKAHAYGLTECAKNA